MKLEEILRAWTAPAGVMILLGGITWGIQLNSAVKSMSEQIGMLLAASNGTREELTEVSKNSLRTSIILAELVKDHKYLEQVVKEHNKESEEWKRRIIQNANTRDSDFNSRTHN